MAYKTIAEIAAENEARKKWGTDHEFVYLDAIESSEKNCKPGAKVRVKALAELMRRLGKDRYPWDMLSDQLKADLTAKRGAKR